MGAAAWRVLTDVRFAVVLITLLAVSGLVGMLVRQFPVTAADDPARYAAELATMHAAWDGLPAGSLLVDGFDTLGLFSVFSTPWFLVLMTVLVVSIICCTLDRTPRLWRSVSHTRVEQPAAFFDPGRDHRVVISEAGEDVEPAVQDAFRRRHFRRQHTSVGDGASYVYGDRNQYQKLATLLTHAGLVLFLAGGAVTVAAGFETVVFVGEGETAPVQAVGTPGNLLVKNHAFDGAAPRGRLVRRLQHRPVGLSRWRGGGTPDHPGQRPAHRRRLRLPPEHLRARGRADHPRCGRRRWSGSGPLLLDDEVLGPAAGLHDHPRGGGRPGRRAQRGWRRGTVAGDAGRRPGRPRDRCQRDAVPGHASRSA